MYCNDAGRGPSHGHRKHAQKFGKGRTCGSGDILADRQTDTQMHRQTHTQTHSSQYFATAPTGDVITTTTTIFTAIIQVNLC